MKALIATLILKALLAQAQKESPQLRHDFDQAAHRTRVDYVFPTTKTHRQDGVAPWKRIPLGHDGRRKTNNDRQPAGGRRHP